MTMGTDGGAFPTQAQRCGDCELVITRRFAAPPALVFRAWAEADLFRRWWMPQSLAGMALVGCEMDVRTGGTYTLTFSMGGTDTMAFHGRYLEVIPGQRIVWTNEEGDDGAITTVTFQADGGETLLTFHERYPSPEALEEALQGSALALPEQLAQLGVVLGVG